MSNQTEQSAPPKHVATTEGGYARFDGMTWPTPSDDFRYALHHGTEPLTRQERFYLSSIVSAYQALVHANTIKTRTEVIAGIKACLKLRKRA